MSSGRRSSLMRPKDQTRRRIERMEAEREARRLAMIERKQERAEEEQRNIAAGNPGDVDFIGLVRKWREENCSDAQPHEASKTNQRICICVRKRPISDKERQKNDHDSITCIHPSVWVHSAKFRVDGITKYLDHSSFRFDHAFDETVSNEDIYKHSTMPLVDFVCGGTGGRATVFAYGQTGSGKTYTMEGIQELVAEDMFLLLSDEHDPNGSGCSLDDTVVTVAFFEIYGGYVQDLLNDRKRLKILEDGKGEVVITGLEEFEANDPSQFLGLVESGNRFRTTHATEANDTSSRSHAICQILLRDKETNRLKGKLSLVDLAGSERGSDTKSHNSSRRSESAEINTSLLSLKECIRALDMNKSGAKHVPYRGSKLTQILKDCFTSSAARTTMIATVSPGASSADHTLNTLRYADRIKEKKVGGKSSSAYDETRRPGKRSPQRKEKVKSIEADHSKDKPMAGLNVIEDPLVMEDSDFNEDTEHVDDLRHTMESLLESEEDLLNLHMSMIQENAELLTEEGKMIQHVQAEDTSDDDIDEYASRLGSILDRKTQMIGVLQERMASFQSKLNRKDELNKRLES